MEGFCWGKGSFGCGSSRELVRQVSQFLDWVWRVLWSDNGLSVCGKKVGAQRMSWRCGGLSIWLLPEQLPLPFPQSDGSAVDVHINMEQAPIQVSWGLGEEGHEVG